MILHMGRFTRYGYNHNERVKRGLDRAIREVQRRTEQQYSQKPTHMYVSQASLGGENVIVLDAYVNRTPSGRYCLRNDGVIKEYKNA